MNTCNVSLFEPFQDDDESTVTMTPRSPIEKEPPVTPKSSLSDKPPSEPKPPSLPPPKREVKPLKPLVKYTKPSPPVDPLPPKPRPVAPQREPTPPRPETPLPGFVTQFKGAEWFDKFFPDASEAVSFAILEPSSKLFLFFPFEMGLLRQIFQVRYLTSLKVYFNFWNFI